MELQRKGFTGALSKPTVNLSKQIVGNLKGFRKQDAKVFIPGI